MPKPKKQTWLLLLPAVLVVLCAMVWLFSSQEDATGELTPADGVLDACGADFAHTVYTLGSDWTFYPETLASTQADLRGRETGAHDESVPYGTYRLELLAQPGQYLMLSGYSFDYSTRVYLNGKQVLEIGKVADTAAASEARINYMDIPIYTGEDGRVEIVCQYANFVHKEGGSLPRLYLSSPEKTQEMQRGNDLYSLALSGGLCLFGCCFLLLAAIQRGPKYGFLALTCWLMGMRNQNFYVVHLLHPEYNWALAYRFLVWMIALQAFALLLLLANLYRGAAKRWVVWCYVGAYGVLSALHFILPTQQVKELTRLCYDVSVPFFAYLIFCLIRRLIRTRTVHWEDGLILLGYALLLGADRAVACDIDEKCMDVAYENAALNGVGRDRYTVRWGDVVTDQALRQELGGPYDVVVANIVADVIKALASTVRPLVKEGGIFLCSGIIDDRAQEVLEKLKADGWDVPEQRQSEGWYSFLCR